MRHGDLVECEVVGRPQLDAKPEDIPLDVVYEDEHVLVINKPAHMVCLLCRNKVKLLFLKLAIMHNILK